MRTQAREYSQEERERLAGKGHALPDGSYPIADRDDLENAIQAIGRAKNPDAARRHIKKRARELGLSQLIPDGWSDKMDVDALKDRLARPVSRLQNGRTDWYRVQSKAGENPQIFIYDEIGYFGNSAKGFTDDLNALDAGELTVHVNSPGGDLFEGLAIYQALKGHKAQVTVQVDGLAASVASVIAMAGDRVVMAPKATMMIHDGWTVSAGNSGEHRKVADLLDMQSDIIASVYTDKAGQTSGFWRERMREETWYNAEEALAAGLIDEIEGREKKADDSFDLSVFAHAGRGDAPAPVLKNEAPAQPVVEEKEEPKPFDWDFAAFKDALREGMK